MNFTQIKPDVYWARAEEEAVNITLVVGSSGCLLVDTGASLERGREIRQAIEQVTDKPLTAVVVTHGHWDHAFGLGAFTDVETIGHENLAADLTSVDNRRWAKTHGHKVKHIPPVSTELAALAARDLGGITVEIASFGQGHTSSDLIVAIPSRQVLVVGDLVESSGPQFDETSSLRGWVLTLDSIYALLRDETVIIPGHGDILHPGQVAHFRTGLAAIWDQAEWAYHRDVPRADVYDFDQLEWPWDRDTVERGIAVAYAELAKTSQKNSQPASGLIGPAFAGQTIPIQPK